MSGFKVCSGKAIRKTPKCLVIEVDEPSEDMMDNLSSGDEILIPESQIHDDSEVYEMGGEGELVISEWLAREKEWLE